MPLLAPRAIDVHAHFLPRAYRESALAHGQEHPDGMPALPEWDADAALRTMDEVGIEVAVLSLSAPGLEFLAPPERPMLAREVNRAGAQAVRARPDRFGLLATLPLPDVAASLHEISVAYDDFGVDGVCLHTHADDVYLGDERLEPVMTALDERAAVVTIHPTSPCGWEAVSFGRPRPMVEFLFDTTRAVTNLILSGVLDRHPAIRWVVPHAGAALPALADRIQALQRLVLPPDSAVDVLAALGRLHYDLAGVPLPRALPALRSLVGPDRLLYGSDYPFTPAATVAALAAALQDTTLLSPEDRTLAFRENATTLLPRLT